VGSDDELQGLQAVVGGRRKAPALRINKIEKAKARATR
jgi:hypothetical protein